MNLLSLGRALRRGWIWVLLILVAALAGGWLVTSSMQAQYESPSSVLYSLNSQGSLQSQIQATSLAIQRAATDAQLVPTPTILTPALEALGDPDLTLETVGDGVTALATETLLDISVVARRSGRCRGPQQRDHRRAAGPRRGRADRGRPARPRLARLHLRSPDDHPAGRARRAVEPEPAHQHASSRSRSVCSPRPSSSPPG